MSAQFAVVKNGRIEMDKPLSLPDGTRVLITPAADECHFMSEDSLPKRLSTS